MPVILGSFSFQANIKFDVGSKFPAICIATIPPAAMGGSFKHTNRKIYCKIDVGITTAIMPSIIGDI